MTTDIINQSTPDLETSDNRFLTDSQHRKALIKNYQTEIKTLENQKQEEVQESETKDQGRLRWFNQQISQLREKIRDLEGEQQ